MSNRNKWHFVYVGRDLLPMARSKRDHHVARMEFWKGEKDAAEEKLRAEGVTLRDYQISGGTRFEAHVDQSLGMRLEECQTKVRQHEVQAKEYAMYARAFELNPSAELALDAEDILFFGL